MKNIYSEIISGTLDGLLGKSNTIDRLEAKARRRANRLKESGIYCNPVEFSPLRDPESSKK